jgi:5-methylcytosine-specific restriction endonuclease McrA
MRTARKKRYFELLFEREQGKCFWCERKVIHYNDPSGKQESDQATLDHLINKVYGGGNNRRNLVLSCYRCNHKRGNTPLKTWIKKLNFNVIKVERIRNPLSLR